MEVGKAASFLSIIFADADLIVYVNVKQSIRYPKIAGWVGNATIFCVPSMRFSPPNGIDLVAQSAGSHRRRDRL